MIRFSLSVAVRQFAGVALLALLLYGQYQRVGEPPPQTWWAALLIAVALLSPEVLHELVKAWKTWRGSDGA